MAKFGKKYRNLQIEEWKAYYINYKSLKHKIKLIKQKILSRPRDGTLNIAKNTSTMPSLNVMPIANRTTSLMLDDLSILYLRKYGKDLKEFVQLLDNELNKCYLFYMKIEKELYKKVNSHLYTQTNYINYDLFEIYKEMCKINKTVFLIKCVNSFINDNMSALKNILKKFDSKLSMYCGRIQTKYILHQLTLVENNKLKYLLQYRIIDESLTICESNLKELTKYFNQSIDDFSKASSRKVKEGLNKNIISTENVKNGGGLVDNDKNLINKIIDENDINNNKINDNCYLEGINDNNIKDKLIAKRKEILRYMQEIDELTYFKIQYGDWFYYLTEENDKLTKHSQKLLENDIFNPILSASFKNDNIIMKFLSKKDGGSEIKGAQIAISLFNKFNIILIIIHSFFYNTLVTCIYPLLFIYIKQKNDQHIYSFIIIVFTYFSSFFFMIVYHNTKVKNIKTIYIISYILFFTGSFGYIASIKYLENINNEYIIFSLILGSRLFIGLGDSIMMGKKYITIYSPRFYISKISLYYIIFQILGLAFGPLIGGLLLYIPETKLLVFEYNYFNCIGWYGCIISFILFFFTCLLFTRPDSTNFFISKNESKDNTFRNSNFYEGNIEDTQDKEYYKLQTELKNKKHNLLNSSIDKSKNKENENQNDSIIFSDISSIKEEATEEKIKFDKFSLAKRLSNINSQKNLTIYNDLGNTTKKVKARKRTSSLTKGQFDEIIIENNDENIDYNPLLTTVQKEMVGDQKVDNNVFCDFNRINMIPRTIDDIIRKEKVSFGYINHNLLVMFSLLFFNNIVKENCIAFLSYYITEKESFKGDGDDSKHKYVLKLDKIKTTCFLTGLTYLSELISVFFIFPFHKINYLFKKYLIILMTISYLLMISLSTLLIFNIVYPYFAIISLLLLINMIIEVISSSYLSYLLPPGWKFSHIRAGALTVYIMILGKIIGCLFCFVSFRDLTWNYFGITIIIFLAYFSISIYLCKSPNLRIKSICRIIQQKKLDEYIF